VLYSSGMKIVVEVEASPDEADSIAAEIVDYLIHVEGKQILSYWVEDE
jgi:hypothetical protein